MEAETTFPQHFYNDTTEIVHVLHAEDGAEIGQCEQWMESLKTNSLHFFGYSAPKMIKVHKYDNFKSDLQCVTIENRQSPFYVVNRVTLTGKKTTLNILLVP